MNTNENPIPSRYSDGSQVKVEGQRNGFTYITFLEGRNAGITTKVPSSWVSQSAESRD